MPGVLNAYSPGELCLAGAVVAVCGLIGFLILGAFGQLLAMQRDRSISASRQVHLLEDILEIKVDSSAKSMSIGNDVLTSIQPVLRQSAYPASEQVQRDLRGPRD